MEKKPFVFTFAVVVALVLAGAAVMEAASDVVTPCCVFIRPDE